MSKNKGKAKTEEGVTTDSKQQPQEKTKSKPIVETTQGEKEYQVFISGIPYQCTEDEIKKFFGEIAESITEVKLPTYQDTGRCKGYAHVSFSSEDAYNKALGLSKQNLKGRYLDIKEAAGRKQEVDKDEVKTRAESMPEDCKTIFVRGLPYEFKEDDIGDRFRKFGEIKGIRMPKNWQTQQFKGFAYVEFGTTESAKKAMQQMHGKELQGRQLKVDFDVVQKPKKSYKFNTSKEGNKFYNKETIKELNNKRQRKEKQKKAEASVKMYKSIDK